MAVQNVSISLQAVHRDGGNVSREEFIHPLDIKSTDKIVQIFSDRGKWASGLVVFFQGDISEFAASLEPRESFAEQIKSTLDYIALWLDERPPGAIESLIRNGLELSLFIPLWIDQDQMELSLPPCLLLACGRLAIKIEMITND
jgi:hypothetical protein